jgi:phosphoglycolate phosphatase-like HAD superfamily hydrolase
MDFLGWHGWRTALAARCRSLGGRLVDSNDAHAQAWLDVLTETGFGPTFEQVRALIGKGGDKLLPELTGVAKDSAGGKELVERRRGASRIGTCRTFSRFPACASSFSECEPTRYA